MTRAQQGGADGIPLGQIAAAAGGRVRGDDAFRVRRLSSLGAAGADSLAFYAGGRAADRALETTAAGAVILRAECAARFARHRVIVEDAYLAYARASALFAPRARMRGIHATARVAASASLRDGAALGAYAVVGENSVVEAGAQLGAHVSVGDDCVIGRDSVLEAGARIGARTRIGARCRISQGAVIGAGGFGYAADFRGDGRGEWVRIEQLGGVRIGDDVDIGANTAIDRGALDDTVIGDGVKLDNHIQIAHNVRIGRHTIMAGCAAVAGSAVIGARCRIGGRASILGHLEIADDVRINAGTFVSASIREAGEYSSMIPAQPAATWRKTAAHIRRISQLAEKMKRLQRACMRAQNGENQ